MVLCGGDGRELRGGIGLGWVGGVKGMDRIKMGWSGEELGERLGV